MSLSGILSPVPLSAQLLGSPQNVVGTAPGVPSECGGNRFWGTPRSVGVPSECGRKRPNQLSSGDPL